MLSAAIAAFATIMLGAALHRLPVARHLDLTTPEQALGTILEGAAGGVIGLLGFMMAWRWLPQRGGELLALVLAM